MLGIISISACVLPEDIEDKQIQLYEEPPQIISFSPEAHVIKVAIGNDGVSKPIEFSVEAADPDGDKINYNWEITETAENGAVSVKQMVSTTKEYTYTATLPAKKLIVGVEVSDQKKSVFVYWIIEVISGVI